MERNIHEAKSPEERIHELQWRIRNIDMLCENQSTTKSTLDKLKIQQDEYKKELEVLLNERHDLAA